MFHTARRWPQILEKLVKALFEWLASLWYEMVEYLLDQLMELFNVDLSYFAERVPVIDDIANIFVAVGWALLIGNLAYQAMRSMVSGVGIEAEEPARLFLRTAMFSFLLLVSRQICDIGFGLSATVMEMLKVPDAITFEPFGEETFDTLPNAGWLIVIIVNVVIQWQLIRLFFEVAERYVILCVLTYCAPLAFAMGGSKSTSDIFRGWLRMFASMCVLMVFNLMFVKLVLSALSTDPNGAAIIPWAMLVVGIVRMAKKMDGIILRIGMNPALTGDPLGTHFPGALTAMTLRSGCMDMGYLFCGESYGSIYRSLVGAYEENGTRRKQGYAGLFRQSRFAYLLPCDGLGAVQLHLMSMPGFKAKLAPMLGDDAGNITGQDMPDCDFMDPHYHLPARIMLDMELCRVPYAAWQAQKAGYNGLVLAAFETQKRFLEQLYPPPFYEFAVIPDDIITMLKEGGAHAPPV